MTHSGVSVTLFDDERNVLCVGAALHIIELSFQNVTSFEFSGISTLLLVALATFVGEILHPDKVLKPIH